MRKKKTYKFEYECWAIVDVAPAFIRDEEDAKNPKFYLMSSDYGEERCCKEHCGKILLFDKRPVITNWAEAWKPVKVKIIGETSTRYRQTKKDTWWKKANKYWRSKK